MSYNSTNYDKFAQHVVDVYKSAKEYDIPDTHIVRHIFPKHHIYISYRQWLNIKNRYMEVGSNAVEQLSLF